ncbi:MAG: TonB-dependent receptor [Kangiella sp.]|nr:TonB-dependent receptor [Kangiella sp.]
MNQLQLSITALLLGSSTLIQAADEAISPLIVTATRTAQSADETLASVTVITREEIETSQANSLMELIQGRTVGLDISRNGGPGSNTSVYLRGSESDHVLVLIDGVRVASVTTGSFNWASIPAAQIERIEIVRGPNSTLYGSDAIGGVIQIFTRKAQGTQLSVGGGSYNTKKATVGNGGSLGNGNYHITLDHQQSDGFSTKIPTASNYEADNDAYKKDSVTAGLSLPLGTTTNLALNLFHSSARNEYDASTPDAYAVSRNSSADAALDWQTSEDWAQRFVLSSSEDFSESFDSWPSKITTRRSGLSWQNDISLNETTLLTFGAEAQRDNGENKDNFKEEVNNNALFGQSQWSGEQYDILVGLRSDKHSKYGSHSTGRLTLGSRLGNGRLFASHATAFKAPTFNELYYPFYGDPDTKPEESASSELGYRLGGFQASLFQTKVTNLIQSDPITWLVVNIGKATLEGLELEYNQQVGGWQLNSGLTLQKAEDDATGERLLRRAEKKLFFTANGPVSGHGTIGIEASYTGPRMDYGSVELTSYTLLNLTGEYRFSKQWSLSGRIENLLDEDYMLANGYNTPGASAYANINFKM